MTTPPEADERSLWTELKRVLYDTRWIVVPLLIITGLLLCCSRDPSGAALKLATELLGIVATTAFIHWILERQGR